ncbi:hypothetical protein C0993_010915 [Termitomyces sp. T159_Od127]|nr:hypothetical protein C0993_010915 [Termitomyces sp. T159_Od127]
MGHHQSPSNSTEHDDHDLVADRLAAELGLEDIIKFSASRRAAAETQFDDEIALYRQLEMFDDAIKTIDDHDTAEILSHAIDRGLLRIESLSAQTAQDDRRAALALSDTGELPPRSEVQKLMDHPILQAFIQSYLLKKAGMVASRRILLPKV